MDVVNSSPGLDAGLAAAILAHAPSLIYACDREGRLVLFNPHCERVTGYRQEQVLGRVLWEFLTPPKAGGPSGPDLIAQAEAGTLPSGTDSYWVTAGGQRRLIHWQHQALLDDAGHVTRLVGIGLDITEHRAVEESVRESERRLQRVAGFLRALRDIDHVITRQKHRHSLVQRVSDILVEARGYYSTAVLLLDERRALVDAAEASVGPGLAALVQSAIAGPLRPWIQAALKHQGAQPVSDPEALAALLPGGTAQADAVALVTALRHSHRAFGVLAVAYPADAADPDEEQGFVEEVAAELSLALYALDQEEAHEQAQAAAREALEQYRVLVETTNSWIATCDLDLRVRLWNPAAEEISGYSMLEVLNSDQIYTWLFPDGASRAQVLSNIERVLRHGQQTVYMETEITCKDGTHKTISWVASPLRGGTGEIIGGVVIGQDVTDRRLAEAAAQERDREFRALFNSAADELLVIDLRGRILEANPAACEMLGYTRDELLEIGPEHLDVPEEAARVPERWDELIRTGQIRFETRHLRRDGSSFPIEVNVRIMDFQGRPVALSIGRDISGRRRAMETIQRQRDEAQRFLGIVPCLVVGLDPEGKITTLNQRACELLGLTEAEAQGRDWFETAVPERYRAELRALQPSVMAQAPEEVTEYENPLLTASGREVPVRWRNMVLRDAEGRLAGTISAGLELPEDTPAARSGTG